MIGQNIKKYRQIKGISLTELAKKAGVSKSYLNSLERNIKSNPSINVINRLAKELDVDINHIITMKEDKGQPVEAQSWDLFIEEAKKAGIESDHLYEYREVISYIKWKNNK